MDDSLKYFSARLARGVAALVFTCCCAAAMAAEKTKLPDIRDLHDLQLQKGLVRALAAQGLTEAVKNKKLSVAIVDITQPANPRVAEVNGHHMMYAASMPKVAILLGAFVEIERGRMRLDPSTRETLEAMIRVSSNEAATTMLRRVGKQNLQNILMSERFDLYDPAYNGGLWVGKEYGPSAAFRRDPLHNISHGATALQTARLYYLLETNRLLKKKELNREMKAVLGNPGIQHKFVKGLEAKPGSKIFRKSGSWHQFHADSAIVERNGHRYIVVAIAEDQQGGEWLADLIQPLDALIIPSRVAAAK